MPSVDHIDSPYDTVEWGAVLQSVSGFEMYCKQFHRANYRDVSEFLILDRHFPRAVSFCVDSAANSLKHITDILDVDVSATKEMASLKNALDNVTIDTILNDGLHEFIDNFQLKLNQVDEEIYKSFFAFES